jgi:NADPH-dependent F420 reductase
MTNDRTEVDGLTIGILGGTGDQGRGLAYRFARAGQRVAVGSRSAERGQAAAADIAKLSGVVGDVSGGTNADACQAADLVIVAVPWDGHAETVASLRNSLIGKIVVDCVNPLGLTRRVRTRCGCPRAAPPSRPSRCCRSRGSAPPSITSARVMLADPTVDRIDLDVMVLGDDRDAVATVIALAARIDGMRGVYAGRLRNAAQVEALTANIIAINRRYQAHAGLRITDV